MRFYIATKLDNQLKHNRLRAILEDLGHVCSYDWTTHGPVFQHGLKRVREVAQLESEGVATADLLIVLWPGGRGTHVELGMGIALGKECHIITPIDNHYVASPETCAFYHHPLVSLHPTINSFLLAVR